MNDNLTKNKLLSALSHAAIFFSGLVISVGIPLIIFFVTDDDVVKENAKESLNFHFNVWLYGIIFGILTWVLIGWVFLAILGIITLVMPVLAILQILGDSSKVYRYPFIFRLL